MKKKYIKPGNYSYTFLGETKVLAASNEIEYSDTSGDNTKDVLSKEGEVFGW